ncbi:MAG: hypothetical protein NC215_09735 [Ruminococcus sp.]|nr:hypothetical protein [Ruminococcus sp.]
MLMVMTAWVFFEPVKADAVNAGKYYVRFTYDVDNKDDDDGGEYTGSAAKNKNGMNITYTKYDGTSGTYIVSLSGGSSVTGSKTCNKDVQSEGKNKTCTARMDGIPSKAVLHIYGSSTDVTEWYLTKIEVSPVSNFGSNVTTLWTGQAGSHNQRLNGGSATITIDLANNTVTESGVGTNKTTNTTNNYKGKPKASAVTIDQKSSDLTVPKEDSIDSDNDLRAHLVDQYGVAIESAKYASGYPKVSFSHSNNTGLKATAKTTATNYDSWTISVNNSAKISDDATKTVTVTVTYKTSSGDDTAEKKGTYTFKLTDVKYTYTLDGNGGRVTSPSDGLVETDYNSAFTAVPNASRTGFEFKGFYTTQYEDSYETANYKGTALSEDTKVTADRTYYAAWQAREYTSTFVFRDLGSSEPTAHEVKNYYGRTVEIPEVPAEVTVGDYTYKFQNSWNRTLPTTQGASNQTYTANYTTEIAYADTTALEEAIANAEAMQAGEYYPDGYDSAVVSTFELALENAKAIIADENKPLASAQELVNGLTETLVADTNALELKKVMVVFVDENEQVIEFNNVTYGDKVAVPAVAEKASDENYHYTFNGWIGVNGTEIQAFDDMMIKADFVAVGHNFEKHTIKTPTCNDEGAEQEVCADCGYKKDPVAIEANGHTWSADKVVVTPATCTNNGKIAIVCTECGAIQAGSEETITKDHAWSAWTEFKADGEDEANLCSAYIVKTRECADCDAMQVVKEENPSQHNFEVTKTVEPTCTTAGYTIETCKVCELIRVTAGDPATKHDWVVDTLPASCKTQGYKRVYCSVCGVEQSFTTTEATDHVFDTTKDPDGWTIEYANNCGAIGLKVKECLVCGNIIDTEILEATGEHAYDTDEENWTEIIKPTCTEDGTYEHKCTVCGKYEIFVKEGSKLGHDYVGVKTPATCTEDGYTTYTCSNCDDSYVDDVVKSDGHIDDENTVTVAPTCTEGGKIKVYCKVCGELIRTETDTTAPDPTGHSFLVTTDGEIKTPATCETPGIKVVPCSNGCGETSEVVIPATGHDWVLDETSGKTYAPTCVTKGNNHYTCANPDCEVEEKDEEVAATGNHTWVIDEEASKANAPTCTEGGKQIYKCSGDENCDAVWEVALPAAGHEYEQDGDRVPGTCTSSAYDVLKCKKCGDTINQYVPNSIKGHELVYTVQQPTNTEDGSVTVTCKNYDFKAETVIEKGNHNIELAPNDAAAKEATCEETGVLVYKCSTHADCGFRFEVEIPMKAHSLETTFSGVCGENGVATTKCTVCGNTIEVNPVKDHVWVDTVHEPLCVAEGFTVRACKRCGVSYLYNYTQPRGHKYSSEPVYEAATCTTPARWVYECEYDDCKTETYGHYRYEIDAEHPALKHNWSEWEFKAEGDHYVKYRFCERCKVEEYELDASGNKKVYFQVQFINPWVTDEYEVINKGVTKLAKTFKDVVLYKDYVVAGADVTYTGKTPTRDKTRAYGKYQFNGWTSDRENANRVITGSTLESVYANTTLYADLATGIDVAYRVVFYNRAKSSSQLIRLTEDQLVPHNGAARYIDNEDPDPANLIAKGIEPKWEPDNAMKYEFTGWGYDTAHIYENVSIVAEYDAIPKTYKIVYHAYDNETVLATQVFQYGDRAENTFTGKEEGLNRPADLNYLYNFCGWTDRPVTDSDKFATVKPLNFNGGLIVPDSWTNTIEYKAEYEDPANADKYKDMTDREKGILHVYPTYETKVITYDLKVIAIDVGGLDVPLGSTVQVLDNFGQIVRTGRIGSDSTCDFKLPAGQYQIIVNSGDDAGTATVNVPDFNYVSVEVEASKDINGGQDHCSCICHSFLGSIWITFLNILYKLFGKKTVCCYDMYAVHGDKLSYGNK